MTDHPTRVERAAENAILKLAARAAMVLVMPRGAFFGGELWGMARKASEAIIEIRGDIRAISGQLTTQINGHDMRLTKLETKNEQQDDRIGDLQQRISQFGLQRVLPAPPTAAEERQREQWQRRQ